MIDRPFMTGIGKDKGSCSVKKARIASCCARDEGGPLETPCRGRFQTAISCYGPMAAVVNVMVKSRGPDGGAIL